jgi:hypothetical protein
MKSAIVAAFAASLALGAVSASAQVKFGPGAEACHNDNVKKLADVRAKFADARKRGKISADEMADFNKHDKAITSAYQASRKDNLYSLEDCQDIALRIESEGKLVKLMDPPVPDGSAECVAKSQKALADIRTLYADYKKKGLVSKDEETYYANMDKALGGHVDAKAKTGFSAPECMVTTMQLEMAMDSVKKMGVGTTAAGSTECVAKSTKTLTEIRALHADLKKKGLVSQAEEALYVKTDKALIASWHTKAKGGFTPEECEANTAQLESLMASVKKMAGGKKATDVARWATTFNAIHTLAVEGREVNRISVAEYNQLRDAVNGAKKYIDEKGKGGLTEADEDQVDNLLAQLITRVATYMSDDARKKAAAAAPPATATKASAPATPPAPAKK